MSVLETKYFANEKELSHKAARYEGGSLKCQYASLRLGFRIIYGTKEQVAVIGGEGISGLCMHSLHQWPFMSCIFGTWWCQLDVRVEFSAF